MQPRRTKAERHAGVRRAPEGKAWCAGHLAWHDETEFSLDSRYGRQRYCTRYHAEYMRTYRRGKRLAKMPERVESAMERLAAKKYSDR